MFGFMDESGSQGVKINENDYLVVALVIFPDLQAEEKLITELYDLKKQLGLSDDYEFHRSHNSRRVQKEMAKLLGRANFVFYVSAIKKDDFRNTASFARISEQMFARLDEKFSSIKIMMDRNPTLYQEIKKQAKLRKLKLKIREGDSHRVDLLQVADYVVGIYADYVKKEKYGKTDYDSIRSRRILMN